MAEPITMNITQIMKTLPHRYPFLLVDRVTECVPGEYIKGYKNVTINENFFQGHFPEKPIMPGVLQLEAMAQLSAGCLSDLDKYAGHVALFAAADNVRFKNVVYPGDRLDMESVLVKRKGPILKCHTKAFVDSKLTAEADVTFVIQ